MRKLFPESVARNRKMPRWSVERRASFTEDATPKGVRPRCCAVRRSIPRTFVRGEKEFGGRAPDDSPGANWLARFVFGSLTIESETTRPNKKPRFSPGPFASVANF